MSYLWKPDASPPRLRFIRLGEPKAPNFLVSAMPRRGLLCLGVGTRLGKGPLCLGELAVPFLFLSSLNSRNHYFLVKLTIELNNKHEIGLIEDLNKRIKESVHIYKLHDLNN